LSQSRDYGKRFVKVGQWGAARDCGPARRCFLQLLARREFQKGLCALESNQPGEKLCEPRVMKFRRIRLQSRSVQLPMWGECVAITKTTTELYRRLNCLCCRMASEARQMARWPVRLPSKRSSLIARSSRPSSQEPMVMNFSPEFPIEQTD